VAACSRCPKDFDSTNPFFQIGQILGPNMAWLLKKING